MIEIDDFSVFCFFPLFSYIVFLGRDHWSSFTSLGFLVGFHPLPGAVKMVSCNTKNNMARSSIKTLFKSITFS